MVDHLQQGAAQGDGVPDDQADDHQGHVGDAGIGHQPFDVGLGQGDPGGIEQPAHSQDDQQRPKEPGGVGKERHGETKQAIEPGLQQEPARSTLPAVGASVWASGSQVCTGIRGILMPKANKKAANNRISVVRPRGGCCNNWATEKV